MATIILFIVLYIVIPPGIFALVKLGKDQLVRSYFKSFHSTSKSKKQKEGINDKILKRLKFTIRDPRNKPIPFRIVFIAIYLIGLGVAMYGGFNEETSSLILSIVIAYLAAVFSIASANRLVLERELVMSRMLELKGKKMRFVSKDTVPNLASEIRVKEWSEDLTFPTKMYLYMPTDFDINEIKNFLQSFNLVFGEQGQWISDATDKKYGGFDFNAGVAALRVASPLPNKAMWHERYLDPKVIHWSYFPLALGSENGVPVYNEELDVTEQVLGFAVNSGQEKLSSKNETIIGNEITAAPQVLIAGGTGGGKALASDTKVKILKRSVS